MYENGGLILGLRLAIVIILLGVSVADSAYNSKYVGTSGESNISARSQRLGYVPGEIIVKFRTDTAEAIEAEGARELDGGQTELPISVAGAGAKFKILQARALFKDFRKVRRRTEELLKKDETLLTRKEKHLVRRLRRAEKDAKVPALGRIYVLQIELEERQSLEEVVAELNEDPDVEYAELNYVVSTVSSPNDPLYPEQWSLNNTGQMYPESGKYNHPPGTPDADIDAPEAWDGVVGASDVIVAVIDTGVDYTHKDLDDNMWINGDEIAGNGVDDDENGYVDDVYGYDFFNEDGDPQDDNGHGTHCAGIIAAEADNGLAIAGVCRNAKIMGLKFLDSGGSGVTTNAAEAVYYAVANGADVISNSWGGLYPSSNTQEAIAYAHSQGVIVVAAAGNEGNAEPFYPAYYEHVISVAATNSNDERAPFSTYGDWVDIAAPGVDIQSLRNGGGTMIKSGTSMACPHVAGVCGILLSLGLDVGASNVEEALMGSTDPIDATICTSGRVNAYQALVRMFGLRGRIKLDSDYYSCDGLVSIELLDPQLKGNGTQEITVETTSGDFETLLLAETSQTPGIFEGVIGINPNEVSIENGTLQVANGELITAKYYDVNDGMGNSTFVTDTAAVDCNGPVIFNVEIDAAGPEPTVSFLTDEPTTARILCGLECDGPYTIEEVDANLQIGHSIKLTGVLPETDYYFVVEVRDALGNRTVDSNDGWCYRFSTNGPNDCVEVPVDYATIQEGVNRVWPGGVVWVSDGTYRGQGNKNVDFCGKAVSVRSIKGPGKTIIDCENDGGGFLFRSGEGARTVLQGFTITNIGEDAAGIYCSRSSPTIFNCVITNSVEDIGAGIMCADGSSPRISNCVISENEGQYSYGIKCVNDSNAAVTNCFILNNEGFTGIGCESNSDAYISNCIIAGNTNGGGAIVCNGASPIISNCTVVGNSASGVGGGLSCAAHANAVITNCIFWVNLPNEIFLESGSLAMLSYCDIQGGWPGQGNISVEPVFLDSGGGDYHLRWSSPCVDAGTNDPVGGLLATDVDGNERVLDGDADEVVTVDIGAYEYVLSPIQKAINNAEDGDVITILPGVYYGNIDFEGKRLIVQSVAPNDMNVVTATVIKGDIHGSAVTFSTGEDANSVLAGFTITGAKRGIYCYATSPTIRHCTIEKYGDLAVELWHGSVPTLMDCTIFGEVVRRPTVENVTRGGIYDYLQAAIDEALSGDEIIVSRGTCEENIVFGGKNLRVRSSDANSSAVVAGTVIDGGGRGAVVTFSNGEDANCVLAGFTVVNGTSGICWQGRESAATVTDCVIVRNEGAGIELLQTRSNPSIVNCVIAENEGAGVYCWLSKAKVSNCSIAGNGGDGIFCHRSKLSVTNSIVYGNSGSALEAADEVTYSDVEGGWEGEGNIESDPCFVGEGDYHLRPDSPCIDVGDANSSFVLEPEPNGSRINMGAYGNSREATTKGELVLLGYELVSKNRVKGAIFDYVYRVKVVNTGVDTMRDISCELVEASDDIRVIDANVVLDKIGSVFVLTNRYRFTRRH